MTLPGVTLSRVALSRVVLSGVVLSGVALSGVGVALPGVAFYTTVGLMIISQKSDLVILTTWLCSTAARLEICSIDTSLEPVRTLHYNLGMSYGRRNYIV